jgi:hypothetical protein
MFHTRHTPVTRPWNEPKMVAKFVVVTPFVPETRRMVHKMSELNLKGGLFLLLIGLVSFALLQESRILLVVRNAVNNDEHKHQSTAIRTTRSRLAGKLSKFGNVLHHDSGRARFQSIYSIKLWSRSDSRRGRVSPSPQKPHGRTLLGRPQWKTRNDPTTSRLFCTNKDALWGSLCQLWCKRIRDGC